MWELLGAVVACVLITAVVVGEINRKKLEHEMQNNNMQSGLVKLVDRCNNVVKLEDICSGQEIEIKGDGIASDISEGMALYGGATDVVHESDIVIANDDISYTPATSSLNKSIYW